MPAIKFSTDCFRNWVLAQGFVDDGGPPSVPDANGYGNSQTQLRVCKNTIPTKTELYDSNRNFRGSDVLVTFGFNASAHPVSFGVASVGPTIEQDFPVVLNATATQSGTAEWFMLISKTGFSNTRHAIFVGSVSLPGGGGDMEVASLSINSGQSYDLNPSIFTFPTTFTYT